ncbi:MAG: response regulator, partial [Thermodesulfobacteriota bacterium]
EDLKRVFNPFVQLESSLTRRHEGTGLGLAMAKRLVEMHGGTIKVESELSRGSTFTVIMPYKAKHREETEVEKADQGSEVPTTGISRDERPLVLIIEDDNPSAELLRSQLETENYRTIRAATAKEGYELAKQHKPDLITLDIMLPGEVDGWELLKGLEDDDTLKTIPVVIVSIAADEQKGFALGASKVLHKPLGKEEFIAAVKSIGVLPSGSEKQATVLVVDDDPRSVEVISHYLKGLGCEVLRAYGGQEGIDMAIKDKPDLILLDLMMPDVSGFDVVDRLRKIPESSGIPIIIVTAKILTREDIETLNSSVTKIVRKGRLDVDGFLTEVKRAMWSSSINEG